ncbi:MAG: SurA N-terminal domain-containing protein [Burkholderiaceae bacterium]|nr:SurA N-terminal domain-containing protein [Burkholderiaceae bacterium]
MLEFIRTHRRLMQLLLLLIIFPSFAFFGLESYMSMGDRDQAVAKVAGQEITQREWDAAQARQLERMKQMFGDQFNPAMFDTPEAKMGALENLIAQKSLSKNVADNHLTVSDEAIRKTILSIPGLTDDKGNFDKARYEQLLAAQNLTPEKFEASLRHDLAMQQVNAAIQTSAFAPKSVAERIAVLNQQKREIQELALTVQEFKPQVKVTDEMLQAFYDKNAAEFAIPDMVKAEFVVLAAPVIEQQVTVTDEDIRKYYEQNAARYKSDEQRRASHILVKAAKDAPAAEKAAAKAKAEKLLAEVRKNPNDFAKVAKANSDDPGSAERGGDLDFFGKGMMVKPFEDTAYALKEGEISGVVESDFGFHIIKVTAIRPASTRPLAEVKTNIEEEIRRTEAGKKFASMVETFSNMVYEQPDSLKPVADKLGLKIDTVSGLTRQPNPALPRAAAYNQPKFLSALFADDALKNKRNTEAVEVGSGIYIAGHVVEHKPASQKPLSEVRAQIEERVVAIEAEKLAKAAGEKKLAELKAGGSAEFGATRSVSRTNFNGAAGPVVAAVMKADATQLPAYVGVPIAGRGYSIYRINSVDNQVADVESLKAEQDQVNEFLSAQEMAAYLGVVKKRAKAEILKAASTAKAPAADAPARQ